MRHDHQGLGHTIEEKLNSFTHGVGAGMSIAGLVFLLFLTWMRSGGAMSYAAFSIYGVFQILLYVSSSLTHGFTDHPKIHASMRVVDQAAIYLLIAGTYTPAALLGIGGPWGWTIFGLVWGMAVAGILMKTVFLRGRHVASDLLYLPMGWLVLIAIGPLKQAASPGLLMWIFIGGGLYTLGILFYIAKKIPFSHVIWHIFVLAGSIAFYLGFAIHLT